jgi:hypothetical protein
MKAILALDFLKITTIISTRKYMNKKTKLNTKITILQNKELLVNPFNPLLLKNEEYVRDCTRSHIVAVKQKRGYKIVKHLWCQTPMNFKNKKELLDHLAEYM